MADQRPRLVRIFSRTLSPNGPERARAEEELARVLDEPNIVEELLATFTSPALDVGTRQMSYLCGPKNAGVALQKYINSHWSSAGEKFTGPLVPESLRPLVRSTVFEGLSNTKEPLRNASAYAVALIGKFDWPSHWPTLMSDIIYLLRNGTSTMKEGSLQVVVELMKETLDEDQLPAITTELLPVLLEVLHDETLAWHERGMTIKIFEDVIGLLSNAQQEHFDSVKKSLDQVGPIWMQALGRLASADMNETVKRDPGLLGLCNNAYSAFSTIEANFPKFFTPYRPDCIRLAIKTLSDLVPYHTSYCVTTGGRALYLDNNYDADLIFGTLALEIMTFLAPSSRAKSGKGLWVETKGDTEIATDLLRELVLYTVGLMQVTYNYLIDWDMDPQAFIAADDEEGDLPYDVRFAGMDLIGSLIDMYPQPVAAQLQFALENTVQLSLSMTKSGGADWWQPLEAVLTLLCALGDDVRSILLDDDKRKAPQTVKIQELYSDVVAGLMVDHEAPYIQGKAFVFAATFAPTLPTHAIEQAVSASIDILMSGETETAVKLAACKAIKLFCRHVDSAFIQPRAGEVIGFLLRYLREDTKDEVLYLALETLHAVLSTEEGKLRPQMAAHLAEAVFDVWLRNAADPVATAIVEELFEMIVSTSSQMVIDALVDILCPRLGVTIQTNQEVNGVAVAGEAIQLVNSLIRTRKGPLEIMLIANTTIAIINCLQTTDDMDIVQHGMLHLSQIVRKDCDKLVQWRGADGRTGVDAIFALLSRFLHPDFSESGAIYVGDLIVHLFRKATQSIQPIMSPLLQTLVTRMAQAKLPSFIESMVLPITYLIGTGHASPTLELLGSLQCPPGASASSAVELVLRTWCEISDEVSGSWNIRVSALGLSSLFQISNPGLRSIMVKGDLIINEANRDTIMTRSRAKKTPNQYTSIPFPLKALKIILKELHLYKTTGAGKGKGKKVGDDGVLYAEDDGDEEWDDDDDLEGADYGKGEFDYLSSWLDDGDGGGRGNDAQEDDEDLREDPVAQIDMVSHLTNVLRQSYASNDNGIHEMIAGLNDTEKSTLKGALTM